MLADHDPLTYELTGPHRSAAWKLRCVTGFPSEAFCYGQLLNKEHGGHPISSCTWVRAAGETLSGAPDRLYTSAVHG